MALLAISPHVFARQHPHHLELVAVGVGAVDALGGAVAGLARVGVEPGQRCDSQPKTDAGYRTVALPPHVKPVLKQHLEKYAGKHRLFVSSTGGPMAGDTLAQAFSRVRGAVGLEGFRFHDLRHTGQTLAAATGATLADLMKRLGHSSPAAAMRYLHTVGGRDEAIAEDLAVLAEHGDAAKLPRSLTTR